MAIIDYLQEYNLRKKLEHWFRVNFQNADKKEISCVPALQYGERFYDFMRDQVILDDSEALETRTKKSTNSRKSARGSRDRKSIRQVRLSLLKGSG